MGQFISKHKPVHAWLASVFLLLAVALPPLAQGAALDPADDAALIALYNASGGSGWTNSTGWSTTPGVMDNVTNPPFGVSFDMTTGRVIQVAVYSNNLVGDISALDLSGLTSLITLELSYNQLSGGLPKAAQLPVGIKTLYLSSDQLTGSIPDYSTLTALTSLNLGNNLLTGGLPTAAQLPPNLQQLLLPQNQLTGSIPDYSGMSALTNLTLYLNQLSGGLPTAAQLPPGIGYLDLYVNQVSGSIPDYSGLTSMYGLRLSSNLLTGSLPSALQLPAGIQSLMLGNNAFTAGAIPDYSSLISLSYLDLENTQRTGGLPTAAQLPPALTNIWLGSNSLTGTIPDYSTLTLLTNLQLPYCQLTGPLPSAVQLPPNAQILNLVANQLSGAIPDYSPLSSLQYLYLNNNQLTGALPPVSALPAGLVQLYLNSNLLGGAIVDYSAIASLTALQMDYLNIQGPTQSSMLSWPAFASFTTSPEIDPALDGSNRLAAPLTVTGSGAEPGGTVELLLDSVTAVTGISVDALGAWSGVVDLSAQAVGTHSLTAVSRFDSWPGHAAGQASTVPSTAVSINVVVDTTPPVITLLGSNPMTVSQGGVFTDPGSTVTDDFDTGLTATVSGTVDTTTVGSYTLTYDAVDSSGNVANQVTRTVNVVDQTAPVISLLGDNPMSVVQGSTFTDPGASVTDNVDTGLTASVSGTVDTGAVGTYTLTYDATDTAGNAATPVTRSVYVTAAATSTASSSGGGGSVGLTLLLLMLLFLGFRRSSSGLRVRAG